ncbi:hypothetical protein B0H15DRAFT_885773 [Mycena belliarum]|uniref:Uncharacterized protein n=1 Tax=Mycena belliarum TaxID=1033014 RepID=A0AAD6U536_9AGAR|nr:hypothetical protein B0H15DRAFT_885773 [Mycena belliae]
MSVPPVSFHEWQQYRQFMIDNPHLAGPGQSTAVNPVSFAPPPATPSVTIPTPAPALQPLPPSGRPVAAAPAVTQAYQSLRPQGQPPLPPPLVAPASFQPYMGMSTLAPNASTLNTSHANQARREAASRHRRPRGPAQPTPCLPAKRKAHHASIEDCMVEDAETPTVRALVLVYPPLDEYSSYKNHIIYRTLHHDFVKTLEDNHLAFRYALALTTPVNMLLERVIADMSASPAAYTFPAVRRASRSLTTSLQVLGLVDSGRPNIRLGVHARTEPHDVEDTIGTLIDKPGSYGGTFSIRKDRWVIRVAATRYPLIGLREDNRRHTCITKRIYALFPKDDSTMGDSCNDTSGGESSSDEEESVARQLWPISSASSALIRRNGTTADPVAGTSASAALPRRILRSLPGTRRHQAASLNTPIAPTRPVTPDGMFSLPPAIWDENSGFQYSPSGAFSSDGFKAEVFAAATRASGPLEPLRVRGADIAAAADHFSALIDDAGRRSDYSRILVADRGFGLSLEAAYGEGPEREVLFFILQRFLVDETVWFQRGEGTFLTLRTLFTISSSAIIPHARITDWKRLGAVCALLLISGQWPGNLSPALFQYLIHAGNFHSLHRTFIGEWFPELRALIMSFLETGPDGNLSEYAAHFATFHNTEVAAYRGRTLEVHVGLAVEMLFKAVLGGTTFDHPELSSFYAGFLLPCRNGFTLPNAIRNFQGGSEAFLSLRASSFISSADCVLPHLQFQDSASITTYLTTLQEHTHNPTLTFRILLERFLRRSGIPCPGQFEESRGAFHPIIDLTRIETPAFRPQIFAWATTGSPFIETAEDAKITVDLVSSSNPNYAQNSDTGTMQGENGTIVFRTCFRTTLFPVEYLFHLAQAQYNTQSEPANFQEAFDYWVLRQCLLGIGRYSML